MDPISSFESLKAEDLSRVSSEEDLTMEEGLETCEVAGFPGGGGRVPEPRDLGSPWKLEVASPLGSPEEDAALSPL